MPIVDAASISNVHWVCLCMHQETELKFVGTEDAMASLRQSGELLELAGTRRARTMVRRAVYFDSADHLLRKAGYVLRVRNEGNSYSQTLKRLGSGELATRPEFKSDVSNVRPELDAIPDSRVRWRITHLLKDKRLEPIFEVDTRRTKILLMPKRNVEIEAAFDSGEIRLADGSRRSTPISEFEVELLRGGVDELFSVARHLTKDLPLTLSVLSKPDRGFRLARNEEHQAYHSTGVQLKASTSADDAVSAIISECLHHLLNNFEVVQAGGEAEGIHQMRVALRKLRVALSLLSPEQRAPLAGLAAQARDVARVLGDGRDFDVLLTDMTFPVAKKLGRDGEFSRLVLAIEARRARNQEAIRACLSSPSFRSFVVEVAAVTYQRPWLSNASMHSTMESDVSSFARRQVHRRISQSSKAVLKSGKLKTAEMHELRIKLKKLRYTTEFFETVLPKRSTRGLLKRVSRLQTMLGKMNDAVVTRTLIRDLLSEQRVGEDASALALAGGLLIGWHGRRGVEKRTQARKLLRKLVRSDAFRKFDSHI